MSQKGKGRKRHLKRHIMDEKKDIYSDKKLSHLNSDARRLIDVSFSQFLKRTERLIAALYLVTDFVSENEILRTHIRERAISLIHESQQSLMANRILREIMALVSVGRQVGLISEMNAAIISAEIERLVVFLRQRISTDNLLSSDAKDDRRAYSSQNSKRQMALRNTQRRRFLHGQLASYSIVDVKRDKRRETILALVKKAPPVTVKDVAAIISDCSEKTLQRELIALVQEGVLKKQGERRWSRYSLSVAATVVPNTVSVRPGI